MLSWVFKLLGDKGNTSSFHYISILVTHFGILNAHFGIFKAKFVF